jgi:hypothetical protein
MTASNAGIQLCRRNSGWLKPALIVLCLIMAGFGAITVAEVTGPRPHAVEVLVPQRAASASTSAEASTSIPATPHEANNPSGEAADGPRACLPYEGDVNDCTFN